ncbi:MULTISPECIES: non-ribosomal peptide synthetase [Cyanophyceae]|uniref:non-ribosomal peptide synthetase n=1 Tax=Cyanophyceae TaxID=3028117 RepID=UPI001686B63F|nr:non-ribosomal peptide synthetase [Trichocoleus sp. FACHB-69]MBD1930354.1 amino acid adenylation domain-containing protein [Trichocoleus sp. FACHB-69]
MNPKSLEWQIFAVVAKITGHGVEDLERDMFLEADLGFDSIKMVELLNALMQLIPEEQQAEFMQAVPLQTLMQLQTVGEVVRAVENWLLPQKQEFKTSPTSSLQQSEGTSTQLEQKRRDNWKSVSSLEQQIFAVVAKITGHGVEDLERDMFLEGDLGFDSIKMVELLNGLMQLIPEEQQARFMQAVPLQNLMQLQTVGEVAQTVENWLIPQAKEVTVSLSKLSPQPEKISSQVEAEVEILHAQNIFLAAHWAVSSCSLCSTLRLNGPFAPDVVQQSWKDLILRHPMLRAHFSIPTGATSFRDYRLVVLANPTPPEISITDLRHCDRDTQEQIITEEVNRCINAKWSLEQWPLHRFFVFRLEDSVYELFFTNHHLISDGLSNQIVLREFMEIYGAKLSNTEPNLPPLTPVKDYLKFVQAINSWQEPQAEQSLQNYLSKQGKDKFFWNPKEDTITATHSNTRSLRYRLGRDVTTHLIACTRDWRLPLTSLLVGAYLRAIEKFGELPSSVILNIPTSGRIYPGVDVSDAVGCFAQNVALSFNSPSSGEDWETLLHEVHREILAALVANYDSAQTRRMGTSLQEKVMLDDGKIPNTTASLIRAGVKSNLFLSNIGQTHLEAQYGFVRVLDYRAATVTNIGSLDTLVEIFNDCLYLNTNYDSSFFTESFVDALCRQFIAQIEKLASLKIQPQQATQSFQESREDRFIESQIRQITEEICHERITPADMDRDLEADLGIDSLSHIRLVTRLQSLLKEVDRETLMNCRTLREMVCVLSKKQSLPALESQPVAEDKKFLEIPYLQIVEQARRTPDAVAVLDETTQLSYQELHRLSNQVANYLRSQGVGAGDLVGIMMRRGSLMLVAILGILKAGGAYVPLDPSYPAERIRYMLEHAEIGILLSEHSLTSKLAESLTRQLPLHTLMFLDEGEYFDNGQTLTQVDRNTWSSWSDREPIWVNTPDDLMTVLYTSGSTGRPKGVMLNHRGYMNRLQWMQDAFQLRSGDRIAQKTSCCFDISVWELFWPLMVGATVCPIETETVKNPWRFAQWMKDTQINIAHFVPSLFGEFLSALEAESWTFPDLRWLIFSGEALPGPFIQRWIDKYGMKVGLANLYGPTEASIDVTAHIIRQRPGEQGENCIPIGKPIDNVYIVILDEQMQPMAPGQLGELWIGGVQLAKGYLKDPQRTSEAFRANPFPHIPGEHLYRTGDLAKELPDGSFEYHGRIDHQVKIRGFRIELGEIESVLNSHPTVHEAAVLAVDYGNGQKRLVAWLAGRQVDNKQIKEHLAHRLPNYMIPHRLEWLPSLPKTHNGKLDRKALQDLLSDGHSTPDKREIDGSDEYLPLGPAQRWLMKYFEPPYQWTGYTRFRYLQPLDTDAFNKALNLVVESHSALRTVFVLRDGQWCQQLIRPEKPLTTEVYDGSHLEAEQRDREIRNLIEQIGQQIRIDEWPLLKVIVVKVHESCYDIAIIGHHIIGDLLSYTAVFNQFWLVYNQIFCNPSESPEGKLPKPSYTDYVRLLLEEEKRGALTSHVDYWKSQFPSQDYTFQVPCDHEKGANVEASAASEQFTLKRSDSDTLLRRAKQHYGCNLYALLLAPLYRLMGEWSERHRVVLSHRSHGRNLGNNQTFMESVGNFAVNFPVGIKVRHDEQWKQTVKQIAEAFDALPMNGITFDWIADQLPGYIYPDNNLTPIRANYLGNRTVPSSKLFEFIEADRDRRLSPPEQKRTTLLEFFFSIIDGTLQLEIEYSRNFHLPATIRKLGERYLELMQEMLAAIFEANTPSSISLISMSNGHPPRRETYPNALRNLPLAGKVAIVTGGGRGIGRAIALKLAEQGAHVAVVARSSAQLEETTAQIREIGGETIAIPTDISDLDRVKGMVESVVSQFGGLDILVNNAGITGFAALANSDPAQWRHIVEVNLFGTYYCCRSVIPHLSQRGQGKIVNLGSDSSLIGYPLFSAYAASKHAISGLTKSLAEELKQQNIQVNAVCPAFVNTDLTPKAYRQESIPVEQIAEVVLFLASPQSNSITGECLKVFGKQDMFFYGSKNMLDPFKNKQ